MPAKTRNLNPIIVYLPDDLHQELERQAKKLNRPISYVGRELIDEALAWRQQGTLADFTGLTTGWAVWQGTDDTWHWWARHNGEIRQGIESNASKAQLEAQRAYRRLQRPV